jgi:hypothetical protein
MMENPLPKFEVRIVRSNGMPTRCRSYGADRNFLPAIAIKIELLRSQKPRTVNRELLNEALHQ